MTSSLYRGPVSVGDDCHVVPFFPLVGNGRDRRPAFRADAGEDGTLAGGHAAVAGRTFGRTHALDRRRPGPDVRTRRGRHHPTPPRAGRPPACPPATR